MTAPWQPLLEWWFGSCESPNEISADKGKLWFGKRDSQDLEARERFGDQVERALAGGLTEWVQCPEGWLALVLLLDQLPRMIFRDTPQILFRRSQGSGTGSARHCCGFRSATATDPAGVYLSGVRALRKIWQCRTKRFRGFLIWLNSNRRRIGRCLPTTWIMPSGIRRSLRGLDGFPIAMRCWGANLRLRKLSSFQDLDPGSS